MAHLRSEDERELTNNATPALTMEMCRPLAECYLDILMNTIPSHGLLSVSNYELLRTYDALLTAAAASVANDRFEYAIELLERVYNLASERDKHGVTATIAADLAWLYVILGEDCNAKVLATAALEIPDDTPFSDLVVVRAHLILSQIACSEHSSDLSEAHLRKAEYILALRGGHSGRDSFASPAE